MSSTARDPAQVELTRQETEAALAVAASGVYLNLMFARTPATKDRLMRRLEAINRAQAALMDQALWGRIADVIWGPDPTEPH